MNDTAREETKMEIGQAVRQGDVWIERIEAAPKKLTRVPRDAGRIVLAYGEVTNHAHAVLDADAELCTIDGVLAEVERVLRVGTGGATVVHEKHGAIALPAGDYRVTTQREWSDADEPIAVRD